MNNKGSIIGLTLLLLGTICIPSIAQDSELTLLSTVRGDWLYVGGVGPGNYSRIQDAIDNASYGDTILVFHDSSPYLEHLIVTKSVSLLSESNQTVVIDAGNTSSAITITAQKVLVQGFTIQNSNEAGIKIINSTAVKINRNSIVNNYEFGVLLMNSSSNEITDNSITNQLTGIDLRYSSQNNILSENILKNNTWHAITVLMFCNHTMITKNIMTFNDGQALYVWNSSHITIHENEIVQNGNDGILLVQSYLNTISKNIITHNQEGITAMDSSNLIKENTIAHNDLSFLSDNTSNNTVYHNNFINNTMYAIDYGTGQWDNGYPSCGNYWDTYQGIDNSSGFNQNEPGSDGIIDTPYHLYGGNAIDRYPLLLPYGPTTLTMTMLSGFFSHPLLIKNTGNTTALNVQWKMKIGGFVIIGNQAAGAISKPLLPGEEITVTSQQFILGLGKVELTTQLWADNAPLVSTTITGILIMFFLIIKK